MKAKEKKGKSVILQLREIREKISRDIQKMTFEQVNEYLKSKKPLHAIMSRKA